MGFSFQPPPPKKTTPPPAPTGDAVASDVRGGKTFSNADGINKTGTLPTVSTSPLIITPGAQDQERPAGIYDGPITVKGVTVPADKVLTGTTIAGTAGTMPNRGAVVITPGATDQAIPAGYHNGGGKVAGVQFNQNALLVGNTVAGLPGLMPNRSAENFHMPGVESTAWAGDRVFIRPPGGFYDGSSWVTAPAPGLVPGNIRKGVKILDVEGTLDPPTVQPIDYLPGNLGVTALRRDDFFIIPPNTKRLLFTSDYDGVNPQSQMYGSDGGYMSVAVIDQSGNEVARIFSKSSTARQILPTMTWFDFDLSFYHRSYRDENGVNIANYATIQQYPPQQFKLAVIYQPKSTGVETSFYFRFKGKIITM